MALSEVPDQQSWPLFQIEIAGQSPIRLEGDQYRIGRASNCDIQINSDRVSRHHATLKRKAEGWTLIDEGSVHGTFVNADLVLAPRLLMPGDKLQFNGSAIATFSRAIAIEQTVIDGPTNPGDLRSDLQALADRMQKSHEENKSFHEALTVQMEQLRDEFCPLVSRVDRIEENLGQFSGVLAMLQELRDLRKDAKKIVIGALGGAAVVSIVVFASAISQDHAARKDFASGFVGGLIEEVGGPGAVGSLAAAVLAGSGLLRILSPKAKEEGK